MESYTITTFAGLNEIDPPDEIGLEAAQALSNVSWDNSLGAIRRRWGSSALTAAEASPYETLFAHSSIRLLATHGTTLEVYDASGSSVTTQAVATAQVSYAKIGIPATTYSFVADGTNALWSFTGSTITAGSAAATVDGVGSRAMPKGIHLAVDTDSNRLVVAGTASSGGPHAATSSGSHVWFSDPGNPFAWDSDNYIQLTPGDGESIVGACTWQGQVFVFKRTKLFVFYGESTDSDGNPIFNYRTVDLSDDLKTWGGGGRPICAASRRGVFYAGELGVYLTTGDQPERVSETLDWGDSEQSTAAVGASVSVAGDRLYVGRIAGSVQSDTFNQTAGALAGQTVPTGGTWAGTGDATDFAVEDTGHTVQRTAVSDTAETGRWAQCNTTTYTDVTVQADFKFSALTVDNDDYLGVSARYSSTSLGIVAGIKPYVDGSSDGSFTVRLNDGESLGFAYSPWYAVTDFWYKVKLQVTSAGYWYAWIAFVGYDFTPAATLSGQDSRLATGGTMATGKVGLYDLHESATAVTRSYDNFSASTSAPSGVYDLDLQTNEWTTLDLSTWQAPIPWLDTKILYSDYPSKRVRYLDDSSYDDDAGESISASWTSGLSNLGYEGEKVLKYVDVWGTGTVSLSVASDFAGPVNPTTLTLGTSTIIRARYETAAAGTLFGIALGAVSGAAFKVHRITLHYDSRPDQRSIR